MSNNVSCLQVLLIFICFCLIMLVCAIADGSMGGALFAIGFVAIAVIVVAILAFINHIKSQR